MWWQLRVPASSANLGPGFDALGLALPVYLECRFRAAPHLVIRASGCDADSIPLDASNLIWQTALTVADRAAKPLPFIELEILNEIPLGKGLGSSAAALTAGVVIAGKLLNLEWSHARILDEAARLEGHPDNVAACALGGIVASAFDIDGHASAIRLDLPPACGLAVIIPDFVLPTAHSRSVLPASYSREEVVFNLQRAGLLVAALATGIGRYALDKGVAYARERSVWDVPIGQHQAVSHPLAEAHIAIEQARLMTQKAATLFDCGLDAGEASNMAKFAAADAGLLALDRAIQTHGGNGMAVDYELSNYWGLARLLRIAPVSREMILNFVAQHTLGLPRGY